MKTFVYAVIASILLLTAARAGSQERRFGLGIILGEPTGISAKLWTSGRTALDFGLGWSLGGDRISKYDGYYTGESRMHFHMDYLWHSFDAINSTERFPIYYGVGGRINTGAGYESSAAVRGVLGILWLPRGTPIDVFLELVPALQLVPSTGFGIDAGIGVRYFF